MQKPDWTFDLRLHRPEIGPIPVTKLNRKTLQARSQTRKARRRTQFGSLWDIMGIDGRQWECLDLVGFLLGFTEVLLSPSPLGPKALSTKKAAPRRQYIEKLNEFQNSLYGRTNVLVTFFI